MANDRGSSMDEKSPRLRRANAAAYELAVEDQFVFTCLRYDSHAKAHKLNPMCCKEAKPTYMFKYHYERLRDAAGVRGWFDAQKLLKRPVDLHNRLVTAIEVYEQKHGSRGPYKVRILLRYHGSLDFNIEPDLSSHKSPLLYPTTLELGLKHPHEAVGRSSVYKVILDVLPTKAHLHTKTKTEWRNMYEHARVVAGIQSYQDAKEVLLYNSDGQVFDASITTPYFFRNGRWVVPSISCGGQIGVTRRWAIEQGLCTDGIIHLSTLKHGEVIWLSNAVKGFFTARYIVHPDRYSGSGPVSGTTSVLSTPDEVDVLADRLKARL